jgi:transcriptional regulator with XRE-family HTH domain
MKPTARRVTPPLVGLAHLRRAHGYTLMDVVEGLAAITGRRYAEGTISAVEIGADRPGPKLTAALAEFYDLTDKPHVYFTPRLVPAPSRAEDVA